MTKQINLITGFLEGLRPTADLSVWEWADKYRMLSSVSSAEPGPWKTSRVPYMKEIFDKLSPSDPTQEVILMKSVQVAGTEAALNLVGCYVDIAPCPIMYVMPTVDMAKQLSKKRVQYMVSECPTLREKIAGMNRTQGSSSILEKAFPGGVWFLTGANSASGLRSNPVKVIVLDEVDAYPLSLGEEGSPVKLAEARTTTFSDKKIFKLSTPTTQGESVIARELAETDEREYHVPCPCCGAYQTLKFEQLKWEPKQPETVKYQCEHCDELINERSKTAMLASGEWKPKHPELSSKYKAGYRINGLYSPLGWLSWQKIVEKFLAEKDDHILFRTWVNTILGEPWEDRGDAPDHERLFERKEDYPLNKPNNDVAMITVGVDVQKDRLELEVVGWCKDKTTYSIDYRVINGDPTTSEPWDILDKVVNETWVREDGLELPMMMMAVDSGYQTQHVYNFCRKYSANKVIPVKGRAKQKVIVSRPSAVDVSKNGKVMGKTKVWSVGVDIIKGEIYANLRLGIDEEGKLPPGYCHFPAYPMEYFKGITAEQLKFRLHKGYRVYEWEKVYTRNEPLDVRCYARAAANIIGIDRFNDAHWDNMLGQYKKMKPGHDQPVPQAAPRKKKQDSFWD